MLQNKILAVATVCIVFLLLPSVLYAQPPGFGGGDDVMDVPVDGGLSLLIAAGVGYGANRLKKKKDLASK